MHLEAQPRLSAMPLHAAIAGSVKIDTISSIQDFDALRPDWNRLVVQLEIPSPFQSFDWNRAWWNHFGGRRQMRIAVLQEHGEVVGIAPFYLLRYGPVGALVPFGWPDRLTELMAPIIPAFRRERLEASLSDWLLRRYPIGFVAGLDPASEKYFCDRSLSQQVYFDWRELPSTWEALLDGLHRSMRGNTRYYPRLLQRNGHKLSFRVASDTETVRTALPILYALHTARANAPGAEVHRDRLKGVKQRAFLHDLAGLLALRGEMKIGILEIDGQDVAAQLWFERHGTLFIHYSGYNPTWARFSVAMIATSEVIRMGIDRGLRRVEFLRGSKQFKTRWNTQQRIQTDVHFIRYPALLRIFHGVRAIRRHLRNRAYRRLGPSQTATQNSQNAAD